MMTETDIPRIKPGGKYTPYIIFICFAAGLIIEYKGCFEIPIDFYPPDFLSLSLCMALVIVVSASVFGPLIFPLTSFGLGLMSYRSAEEIIEAYTAGGGVNIKLTLFTLAALPVFFVLSTKGIEVSGQIIKALSCQSMAAKDKFNRNSFPIYAGAMLLLLAAFILTEIKA